ncbi:hypothetical protein CFOL_v3_29774 [Cephalotus follicularis]|uniref:Uncharacterized protein n=1 Tax=Cephalotus follicularis TaxID=3775 RepID=A0A1Q3D216_CEPFO|nr:hypothetical protein CFOL_v3_29774 [Cephalotus follicularis]
MASIQTNVYQPSIPLPKFSQPLRPFILPIRAKSNPRVSLKLNANASICLPIHANSNLRVSLKLNANASSTRLQFEPLLNHHRPLQRSLVCLLGGKDKSEKDAGSPWKALEKTLGNFKGQSIEDVLRQQIEKQEFSDGGSGENPPRGGGGGGGEGGDGSGGSENEGLADIINEVLQVVLATVGFIFLYIFIISGEELTRLGKDYIKYLFKGTTSVRLRRAMYKWRKFFESLNEREVEDPDWLAKEIINTPTWYDSPEKYRHILRSKLSSDTD